MLSPTPAEAEAFIATHRDIQFVDGIFADLCGIIRGKRYPIEDLHKILMRGITIPASSFLLSVTGGSDDPLGLGVSDGDPDNVLVPIPGMLKPVPWAERPLAQVYMTMQDREGKPFRLEPRNVLARVVERFAEMGLTPVVALELEFYLIDRERTEFGAPQPPLSPASGLRDTTKQVYGMAEVEAYAGLLGDITAACDAQEIPYGAITAEYAPGQFEINLDHVADSLLAADHAVLLKRVVKGCARRHGIQATFAPKPYPDEVGSGLHAHISLIDKEGRNVFDNGQDGPSDLLRHGIGGCLDLMAPSMAIFAPNPNGFRRYRSKNYAPVSQCWGVESAPAMRCSMRRA
ncbi:MAG: glutamine synthetase family protein [Pseudomonadota bacterium]